MANGQVIAIAGASGYLGRRLTPVLQERGYRILPLLHRRDYGIGEQESETYEWQHKQLVSLLAENHVSCYINLACRYAGEGATIPEIIESNLTAPLNILDAAAEAGVRRCVSMGTSLPPQFNVYSCAKDAINRFGALYAENNRITFAGVACEMFFGPGEPKKRFIAHCVDTLRRNAPLALTEGTQRRDLVYIDEVIRFFCFLLEHSDRLPPYSNIPFGTGEGPTIRQIVSYLAERMGSTSELQFGAVPMRANEPDSVADMTLARSLGFDGVMGWKAGLDCLLREEHLCEF